MESINDLGFKVLKGERFVVIEVENNKLADEGYDFIDGLLNKGYDLVTINSINMSSGYIAYLKK
jgi:hypothetical protein